MEKLALILTLTGYTITDGDTLRAGDVRVRLWGIDAPGTRFLVDLPQPHCETIGQPVEAESVELPFRPSAQPGARERADGHASA